MVIVPYVMNRSTMWPMTLSIYNFYGRRISVASCDVVLTIGQRYLISGMTAGAIKG